MSCPAELVDDILLDLRRAACQISDDIVGQHQRVFDDLRRRDTDPLRQGDIGEPVCTQYLEHDHGHVADVLTARVSVAPIQGQAYM